MSEDTTRERGGQARPPRAPGTRLPFPVAPTLSAVGLVVVAAVSYALLGGSLPTVAGPGGPSGPGGPVRTATPSNVVIVDPRANVPGSLLYAKDGNIWVQSGKEARQITSGGQDSMPAWSPDGSKVYYVHATRAAGRWLSFGVVHDYNLSIPSLMWVNADGSGGAHTVLTGRVKDGSLLWSYFIREPAISPDGTQAAIITDGPDPTRSDVVLKLLDLTSGKLTNPGLAESLSLGHQDPAWSPDGKSLLYVRNQRDGARGTPVIARYNVATGKSSNMTTAGYSAPSWSRDGRYVAATKTSSFGTDVVLLDAKTGTELLKITNDELSFSPVWSPAGDSVAFFKLDHGVVDLYLVPLTGTAPNWTAGAPIAMTIAAGLDGASRPAWFIPGDQLPPLPTATPATTPVESGAPSSP